MNSICCTVELALVALLAWIPNTQGFSVDGLSLPSERPLNLGHRGACGVYPEHTALAYSYAIEQGADGLECDIQVTRDLQLVCLHESWMEELTNVEEIYPEDRKNTYFVPDRASLVTDYFACDFTLEELMSISMVSSTTG